MARKIERSEGPPAAGDELEILHPEREATVAGRRIVVREYGFVEGMRLRPLAAPIVEGLHAAFAGENVPTYEQVLDVLAVHIDSVIELIARAADVEPEWIRGLPPAEGDLLLMLWWGANGPFFTHRVLSRIAVERETARLLSAGATSTPPSSDTATTSNSSAAAPSVN